MAGSPLTLFFSAIAALAVALWVAAQTGPHSPFQLPFVSRQCHDGSYATSPYSSSWISWWNKDRHAASMNGAPLGTNARGQGGGAIGQDWNVLYHLGGNGPWVEKVDGVLDEGIAVPEGCNVEQVHMMSRHHERYPTRKAGSKQLDLLNRIKHMNITLKGDLEFVNRWQYFTPDPRRDFEQLTSTGPFSGVLGAFTTGVRLRTRYRHLLPSSGKTNFWAGDSSRVIDTARYFAAGFFGLDWKDHSTLHVIPETAELGADTLTPGDTCLAYIHDLGYGHDYGARMLAEYRATYLSKVQKRLLKQNPDISFTDTELYSMQEMCGFETTVHGSSAWCDVFSKDEWLSFEYARDVIHFYRAGPGNRFGALMGWLWLNATTNLLLEGPSAGPFFFSFVHDGDIVPMLAALDIFHDNEDLPITRRADDRAWKTSQVTPMGGRVTFERLSCPSGKSESEALAQAYVRVNINDGIVPVPGCDSGPGGSCPLRLFAEKIKNRGVELGDYREKCGLGEDMPDRITFLHQ
ncbi:phosphoglycerate mutase-like protein [Diplodia corticola]|uniref:Phosphoglycerate mutase-like protein n=1 Tax=Diplodia corticola TaxID=236234 RepID=A0A1J9R4W9_9PEZI|nr:phosphoglycerate mutase-like protein [Diplodia corticola]OJD35609.1 phosphoglycerate mutase-like protein [Diplodia corticola]